MDSSYYRGVLIMATTKKKGKKEELEFKRESGWIRIDNKTKRDIFAFSESYKKFINHCKIEREVVEYIKTEAVKSGFKNIKEARKLKKGDKVFYEVNSKSIYLAVIGEPKLKVVISHVDSPRLDLKPFPIIEDALSGLSLLKTHYYGGIKKYQWVNIPLAIHGVIITKKGKISVSLGDEDDDKTFVISDLLPHLAQKQMEKTGKEIIEGENLSIIFGNMPIKDKGVKANILKILNEEYKIKEENFVSAELEVVPAFKAKDVGLDKSMIGAYGHDDRSCSFALLSAILKANNSKETAVALFVDKEEIGSEGNTSAQSAHFINFIELINEKAKWNKRTNELLTSGEAISADVTSAFDPIYQDVFDKHNASYLSRGVSIEKYNGSGGKYYGNDANAEFLFKIIDLANKNKIIWQSGEIGKIDIGGGGTVAVFLSKLGFEVVDAGIPVLGMHSPYEVISKLDLYSAYQLYKVFLNGK